MSKGEAICPRLVSISSQVISDSHLHRYLALALAVNCTDLIPHNLIFVYGMLLLMG